MSPISKDMSGAAPLSPPREQIEKAQTSKKNPERASSSH